MLRIALFKQPLGRQPYQRTGFLQEDIENRDEAVQLVEQHIRGFSHSGFNGEQGYWWCRNDTDKANIILRIEPM